jgi:hypothetical protein
VGIVYVRFLFAAPSLATHSALFFRNLLLHQIEIITGADVSRSYAVGYQTWSAPFSTLIEAPVQSISVPGFVIMPADANLIKQAVATGIKVRFDPAQNIALGGHMARI